jgi:TIR domain
MVHYIQGGIGIDEAWAPAHNAVTPAGSAMKPGKIFINYRRDDSRADAGRLYDRLHARYPARIFRDVGSLEPGIEWREAIEKVLSDSDACIVVIGKNWLTMTDTSGRRRLDDPRDVVRLELQKALSSGMRVFPLLVGGARMPAEEDLPADLQSLARRNALEVSEQDWNEDFDKLVAAIEKSLGWSAPASAKSGSRKAVFAIGGAVAALLVIGVVIALMSGAGGTQPNGRGQQAPDKVFDPKLDKGPSDVTPPDGRGKPENTSPPETNTPPPQKKTPDIPPAEPVRQTRPAAAAERAQPPPNRVKAPEPEVTPLVPNAPAAAPVHRPTPVENAQDALASGRLVLPRNDSALHWALQAQQTGEPGAADVLQRTNTAILNQMQELTKQKRFDEALSFVNAYAEYYPGDPAMQRTFQQIRDGIRQAQMGGPVTLQVLHRHGIDYRTARCEGWLAIDAMGNVSYACDPKFVHDARCDRATFPTGSFTYKTGPDPEQLHFSTASGNFDFFAPQPTVATAVRALSASGARIQQK